MAILLHIQKMGEDLEWKRGITSMILDKETEVYAKLVVESTSVPTSELVHAFKVRPCREWSIGDEDVRSRKTFHKKTNGFSLCSAISKCVRAEEHIADINRQLKDVDGCLVQQIHGKYDAAFRIGIDKDSDAPICMTFERDFLAISALIGASIDIDIIYLTDATTENNSRRYDPLIYKAMVDICANPSEGCIFRTCGMYAFEDAILYLTENMASYKNREVEFHVIGESPCVILPKIFVALVARYGLTLKLILSRKSNNP